MVKIYLFLIGLVVVYSLTIVIPMYKEDPASFKENLYCWLNNYPILIYIGLAILVIVLIKLVGLIINLLRGK